MNAHFFTYLIESSVYLLFFLIVFKLTIANQTHFTWMRGYLLLSLVLSVGLPLITLPFQWTQSMIGRPFADGSLPINIIKTYTDMTSLSTVPSTQLIHNSNSWKFFLVVVSFIYLLGAIYKSIRLIGNLNKIFTSIKRNFKYQEGTYWLISTDIELPAFSFFNFIFINRNHNNLTNDEFLRIKDHEIIHAKQWHSLDILFVEIISIIFWFNPLILYAKNRLQEIHEFIADEESAGQGEMKKKYAQLLFNLATDNKSVSLMTGFSGKQITKRIMMVSKQRSMRWSKLLFIPLFPVAFALLLSFSYLDNSTVFNNHNIIIDTSGSINSAKIGKVKYVNNTLISSSELVKVVGLKKEDEYEIRKEDRGINVYKERIMDYYLDKGYLFANVEATETFESNGKVDITFTMFEGDRYKIATISVKGNKNVPTDEILNIFTIKPGDLFSKSKIVESVRALSMSNKFDPEKIKPDIIPEKKSPNSEFGKVNIIFEVVEK